MRLLVCIAATLTMMAGAFSLPASAAQPPRVPGYDCRALGAQVGPGNVWQTVFTGWREDIFGRREDLRVAPCFASQADCNAWLYWAQTDWPHNFIQHPRCQIWRG